MIIDTHCHLNFRDYEENLSLIITNAKKAGVKKFIVPGVDYYSSLKSIELSYKFPEVTYAAIGFHPYETDHDPDISRIESMITSPTEHSAHRPFRPVIAIGECGLDFHLFKGEKAEGKKDRLKYFFAQHIQLANKYNLPLIIHCRDAFNELFDVIDSTDQIPRGVIHCFSGGLQDIRSAVSRNLYLGIDGNVTYSKNLQAVIAHIPQDRLLLETDSPNLTPIPYRGRPNEPKYINYTAKKIAGLINMRFSDLANMTTNNAIKLFNIHI